MRAHIGDWLVVPATPGRPAQRGRVVGLMRPDGQPPYRVWWLDDDHEGVVVPPPEAHVICPSETVIDAGGQA